jgi:hypothetical protein
MICICAIISPKASTGTYREDTMTQSAQQATMQRKPIMMPLAMIRRIDRIAKERNVSFAEVVRNAVDAFDSELSQDDLSLLETLADSLIASTRDVINRIDALEKQLDETHAMLEDANGAR